MLPDNTPAPTTARPDWAQGHELAIQWSAEPTTPAQVEHNLHSLAVALELADGDVSAAFSVRDDAQRQQVAYAAAGFRQASIRANAIVHRAERIVAMAPKRQDGRPAQNADPRVSVSDDTNADQQQRSKIRSAHANVPDDQFDAMLARAAETGEPLTRKAIADAGKQNARDAERAERDAALAQQTPALAAAGDHNAAPPRYAIILADPPWRYEFSKSPARDIENQYPTMTLDEIKALPVNDLAADTAALYLWATAPKLPEALDVMAAWGFSYRTNMVWVKDSIGMGYWARGRHEHLLIGVKGAMPPPPAELRPDSVISAPRQQHSAKPDAVPELLDELFPAATKIELFARTSRPHWAQWGNECRQPPTTSTTA